MSDNPESRPPIEPPKFHQQDDRWSSILYRGGFALAVVLSVSYFTSQSEARFKAFLFWYVFVVWIALPASLIAGRAAAIARAAMSQPTEDEHLIVAYRDSQPELVRLVNEAATRAGAADIIEIAFTDGRQISVERATQLARRAKIPLACLGVLSVGEFSALLTAHFCAAALTDRSTGVSYSKGPPFLARFRFALSQDSSPFGKLLARFLAVDLAALFVIESQIEERVWRRADAAAIGFVHPRLLARAIEAELVLFHLQPWMQAALTEAASEGVLPPSAEGYALIHNGEVFSGFAAYAWQIPDPGPIYHHRLKRLPGAGESGGVSDQSPSVLSQCKNLWPVDERLAALRQPDRNTPLERIRWDEFPDRVVLPQFRRARDANRAALADLNAADIVARFRDPQGREWKVNVPGKELPEVVERRVHLLVTAMQALALASLESSWKLLWQLGGAIEFEGPPPGLRFKPYEWIEQVLESEGTTEAVAIDLRWRAFVAESGLAGISLLPPPHSG